MIILQRPGRDPLEIEFILLNFEGTLATNRRVHPKAKDKLNLLSKRANIFILTRGNKEVVSEVLKKVKAEVIFFKEAEASEKKLDFVRRLGGARTVAIGNGFDDALIMEEVGLGICVIGKEGASAKTMGKADVVVINLLDALDFLLKPLRHQATLAK